MWVGNTYLMTIVEPGIAMGVGCDSCKAGHHVT